MQPHQYSPNQHSNQPYVTTQRPNHQFSSYDQPVFHNTSHVLPSHQYSNAYYQYDHIQNREQDIEINHSVNFHPDLNDDRNICKENLIEILPTEQKKVNNTKLSHSNESYRNDKEVVNNQQSIGKSDPNWFHISLEEHWLFHCQLKMLNDILLDYKGVGKAVDSSDPITPWRMPRGYGSTNSQTEFQECIDLLNEILTTYELTHQIIIGGDFNEEIFGSNDSIRQKYIVSFIDEHCLSTKDIGKTFISANGSDCTAIDYILFQETFKESIINIKKCEFTGNVSDH
ncbi:unnamed protein product [Mytilus edulis]|uniref:Endonuclease/exonuclease/phosphatase domain-containing protein n=1 Tax=Mytilus edulis TaxID=6550 RepID=A0A8S3QFC2_MYTED|nr:unnamed protein product [Mytilus edulis]